MKISVLSKGITNNSTISYCISRLWRIPDYYSKMNTYSRVPKEEIFMRDMIKIYVRHYQDGSIMNHNETRTIKQMLREWNPDSSIWIEYGFPREIIDRDEKAKIKRTERANRKESLDFLYDQLEIARDSRPDIVDFIARNNELYSQIMIEKDKNNEISIDTLYNICEQVIIPKITSDEKALFFDYKIMNFISNKRYNDQFYWAKSNHINVRDIQKQIYSKDKVEE